MVLFVGFLEVVFMARFLQRPLRRGILASMLLPTLAKAKKKANRLKCSSGMGQMAKAFTGSANDQDGYFQWEMSREDLDLLADDANAELGNLPLGFVSPSFCQLSLLGRSFIAKR